MRRIKAGDLDQEIRIEEPTEGDPSASGETTKTWAEVLECWAKVEPQWGTEYERAQQQQAEMTHLLMIRYSPDVAIKPKMRIKLGSRTLHILAVRNVDETNVALQLTCKEEVS